MAREKDLETGLVLITALVIIYLVKHWLPLLVAGLIIGVTAVFLKKPASWITWLWYRIVELLGKIVPKMVLSIVFLTVLLPLSFFFRMSGGDRLRLKHKARDTMWIRRDVTFSKDDLVKPW